MLTPKPAACREAMPPSHCAYDIRIIVAYDADVDAASEALLRLLAPPRPAAATSTEKVPIDDVCREIGFQAARPRLTKPHVLSPQAMPEAGESMNPDRASMEV
jgi:hypothetical protein